MPWEVGYFDGLGQGVIGIIPVLDDPNEEFKGMEFLGLYSVIDVRTTSEGYTTLFAEKLNGEAVRFKRLIRDAL